MTNDSLTEITCRMSDCIYYHSAARDPLKALCTHKDASRYVLSDPPCPLYRLDWQKKMRESSAVLKPHPLSRRKY